jgi:chemotaxis family two-component system response regulator Rcp1
MQQIAASEAPARDAVEILLVEDNPADARMIGEALNVTGVPHRLHVVEDSLQALEFINQTGRHADAPRPHLMLLDLSLPGVHGHELLAEIRADRSRPRLPIVVLTGSTLHQDLERSYELQADEYISKPVGLMQYAAELRFALRIVRSTRTKH